MSAGMAALPNCEVCAADRVTVWATVRGYVYYRCRRCSHLYVHPRPSPADVEACYLDATFYENALRDESRLVEEATRRVRRLDVLAARFGLARRLLDVGCASGIFLERARAAGWSVAGLELSPVLAAGARARGFTVGVGSLEAQATTERYPLVTAWEVLEHARQPIDFLERLRARVAPGGLLALSTPLSNGLPARLLRARFPMICPPEHLSLFSRRSLELLAREVRLDVVAFRSFSNLKPENLARGLCRCVFDAPEEPDGASWRVASVLSYVLAPVAALVDVLGAGSEMEVVFRRSDSAVGATPR